MQEYVLVFAYDWSRDQYIFVEKDRPDWQAGRVNLPGGKIEPGELPYEAAIREFEEECGITLATSQICDPRLMGLIQGQWGRIYCFRADLDYDDIEIKPREGETERFFWEYASYCRDPKCLPNLRIIVPMLEHNMCGWSITDNNKDINATPYIVQISLGAWE